MRENSVFETPPATGCREGQMWETMSALEKIVQGLQRDSEFQKSEIKSMAGELSRVQHDRAQEREGRLRAEQIEMLQEELDSYKVCSDDLNNAVHMIQEERVAADKETAESLHNTLNHPPPGGPTALPGFTQAPVQYPTYQPYIPQPIPPTPNPFAVLQHPILYVEAVQATAGGWRSMLPLPAPWGDGASLYTPRLCYLCQGQSHAAAAHRQAMRSQRKRSKTV